MRWVGRGNSIPCSTPSLKLRRAHVLPHCVRKRRGFLHTLLRRKYVRSEAAAREGGPSACSSRAHARCAGTSPAKAGRGNGCFSPRFSEGSARVARRGVCGWGAAICSLFVFGDFGDVRRCKSIASESVQGLGLLADADLPSLFQITDRPLRRARLRAASREY